MGGPACVVPECMHSRAGEWRKRVGLNIVTDCRASVRCLNSCLTHIHQLLPCNYHPLKMRLCNSVQEDTNLLSQILIHICIKPPLSIAVYLCILDCRPIFYSCSHVVCLWSLWCCKVKSYWKFSYMYICTLERTRTELELKFLFFGELELELN